ncbi:MAG: D-alanine--D-alanine ligase [Bacteroidales bacterium]|nr:D-alanine--D-alanine ligase [Bacteroidales bacterium]
MKKNIAIVMGGYSGEHDISIMSGTQVYQCINADLYNRYRVVVERDRWFGLDDNDCELPLDRADFTLHMGGETVRFDLAFILIHGNPGENGVLQGYFDMLGIPYTTCGFYTSALTFNKAYCNAVVREFGVIKVARSFHLFEKQPYDCQQMVDTLGLPLFVKPAAGGSSVATTKVKSLEQLEPAIREAFTEDKEVLVEQFIKGREFDCGVFRAKDKKYVFPVTEIIPTGGHEFFDYDAKYNGFSNEVTPAQVEESVSKEIQEISSKLYDMLNCEGIVRFDYLYDVEKSELYFMEVNTIPGQSPESIVPKEARAVGITPTELYHMAIEAALR